MVVSVRALGYRYPGARESVLHGLEFDIREGEVFGFLGPNGSGKSTTKKLLAVVPALLCIGASALLVRVYRARAGALDS